MKPENSQDIKIVMIEDDFGHADLIKDKGLSQIT